MTLRMCMSLQAVPCMHYYAIIRPSCVFIPLIVCVTVGANVPGQWPAGCQTQTSPATRRYACCRVLVRHLCHHMATQWRKQSKSQRSQKTASSINFGQSCMQSAAEHMQVPKPNRQQSSTSRTPGLVLPGLLVWWAGRSLPGFVARTTRQTLRPIRQAVYLN